MASSSAELLRMARLYGIQTAYYDVRGRRKVAQSESLLAVLRALGVEIDAPRDAGEAVRRLEQERRERGIDPVVVAWDDKPLEFDIFLPAGSSAKRVQMEVELETGERIAIEPTLEEVESVQHSAGGSASFRKYRASVGRDLPWGYHRLSVETGDQRFEALLLSAPRKAVSPGGNSTHTREWSAFLPLYALQTETSWGAGSYSDLAAFGEWLGSLGGSAVATLPLLPAYLDSPCEPSPYAPMSRLFWNEFYIDVAAIPELPSCDEARRLLESSDTQKEIEALRGESYVDYRRLMAVKRRVLEPLSRHFFQQQGDRFAEFQRDVEENSEIRDYARFRAAHEKQGKPWPEWSEQMRGGRLSADDYDRDVENYYLYSQWIAGEQMETLARRVDAADVGLYLDFPLGVHQHGYDVWRHQEAFVADVAAGAPPDAVFTKGQNWGFSPIHPEAIRHQNYTYVIHLIRHHMRHARMLRIDHVMGLHRLFCIPSGMEPSQGVYVHYRSEELYAILNLESHRHRAVVVGENLGTVPSYVNTSMRQHHMRRMYVLQYDAQPEGAKPLGTAPRASVASLNTHDMPTFAAFWNGDEIRDWLELGLLDESGAEAEHERRARLRQQIVAWFGELGLLDDSEEDVEAAMHACLDYLATGNEEMLVVTLEDLWLERRPQNIPGTSDERPNWRRKAQYAFEEFKALPAVVDTLERIDQLRRKRGRPAAHKDGKARS